MIALRRYLSAPATSQFAITIFDAALTLIATDRQPRKVASYEFIKRASDLCAPLVRISASHSEGLTKFEAADLIGRSFLSKAFSDHRPEVVLHAAAFKHVPLSELNPIETLQTNVRGKIDTLLGALDDRDRSKTKKALCALLSDYTPKGALLPMNNHLNPS